MSHFYKENSFKENSYKEKYLKYKKKYLEMKKMYGSGDCFNYGFQQHFGECWHDSLTMILFQSDVINKNNEFVQKLIDLDVDERTSELQELFSPENFQKNIHKTPTSLYLKYLEYQEYPDKLEDLKKTFLEESNIYIKSLKDRLINRLEFDQERYNPYLYLPYLKNAFELFIFRGS